MEAEMNKSGPYLLGDTMCALDIYAAMMSRWRPGRLWIRANCPLIAAAVEATEAHPVIGEIFNEKFRRSQIIAAAASSPNESPTDRSGRPLRHRLADAATWW